MPPKRRLQREDSESSEEYRSKRLRSAVIKEEPEEIDLNSENVYEEIVDYLCSLLDEDDRPICEMFNKLPSKDAFPVYYDIINEPIDFRTIKKKIKTHQYSTINDLETDIFLLIKNAHTFNEPKSQIFKDATQIKKSYLNKKSELFKIAMKSGKKPKIHSRQTSFESEDKTEDEAILFEQLKSPLSKSFELSPTHGTPTKDDGLIDDLFEHDAYSILYNMVVAYSDHTGRRLSAHFIRLPHKRAHQSYYEIVKNPISLCKIRNRVKMHYYSDLNMLESDFSLVFNNAIQYYPSDSPQFQDAQILNAFLHEKKLEMESCEDQTFSKMGKIGNHRFKSENSDTITPLKKRGRQPKEVIKIPMDDQKNLTVRAKKLFEFVMEYKNSEGRALFEMFEILPKKEEYPDYYKIISTPIDLKMIEERINLSHYNSEDQLMQDFELLFKNARQFNEEGSEIYNDSIILEKALKKKQRLLNQFPEGKVMPLKNTRLSYSPAPPKQGNSGPFTNKCHELLSYIQNYTDEYGNNLSTVFEKLPSRLEYPDYYQLIKRPIDLTYISSRVNKYVSVDDLEQDLLLLFNNACHYNEPDSQIYKDAIVLLRVMIAKKNEISPDLHTFVPDVAGLVQKLLETLYTNIMQHKDEEGRCYSDSLVELLVTDDSKDVKDKFKRKPISLIIIGQLLQLGFYKRLDRLQEDIFMIFNHARKTCSTETEMYEDACELQMYFILERDRLTKDGLHFLSQSALNITSKKLQHEIDTERDEKQVIETQERLDESDGLGKVTTTRLKGIMSIEVHPDEETLTYTNSIVVGGITYLVGDFVYMNAEEMNRPPHIVSIEKIWRQENGLEGLYGNWYFRPEETFHLASRKFMEQEVFRSLHSSYITFQSIIGKCYVMSVKDYPKYKPEGFEEKDIFVYESRYNTRMKSFKKVKTFPPHAAHVVLNERKQLLSIKRISPVCNSQDNSQSLHCEKDERFAHILESCDGYEHPKEEHCKTEVSNPDSGCTYYEKYVTDTDSYKIGDGVYVRCDEDYLLMSKIDKIWTDTSGTPYFQGNWYLAPEDTKHMPTQLFYEKECFESTVECVAMLSQIAGKCAILNLRDYQFLRPTEIEEKHIYICSAIYIEEEMKFRRRTKGFKRATLPANVRDDELWYFDESINPKRRPSLWLMPWGEQEIGAPVQKSDIFEEPGYNLMKKDYKALLMRESSELSVEEAECKTREKWKSMSNEEKHDYKLRQSLLPQSKDTIHIYECAWGSCEYQFEDISDLILHVMEGVHLSKKGLRMEHGCLWRGCLRKTNNLPAFVTHSRLVRHIREVHFKNAGKLIHLREKSKWFFLRNQSCDQDAKESITDESSTSSASPSSPITVKTSPNLQSVNTPINKPVVNPPVPAGMYPPFSRLNVPQPAPQAYVQQHMVGVRPQAANIPQQSAMNPMSPQMFSQIPLHQQQGIGMSIEQQQMLYIQVQRQQQQIQQLQQKIDQLQDQSSKDDVVFVSPADKNALKMRHSEIYVRYIEGLRDNRQQLSSWNELASDFHPLPAAPLPTHWFPNNCENIHEALWELRDRMLRDAVALSKIV